MTLGSDLKTKSIKSRVCVWSTTALAIMCQTTDGIFSPPTPLLLLLLLYRNHNVSGFRFSLGVCQSYTAIAVLERFTCAKGVAESRFFT